MPTIRKDFKDLRMPDQEMSFSLGFTTALVLVVGVLKMFGVM